MRIKIILVCVLAVVFLALWDENRMGAIRQKQEDRVALEIDHEIWAKRQAIENAKALGNLRR